MGSHRRLAPSGLGRGRGATAAVVSAAAAAAALGAVPAHAAPRDHRATVDRLYLEAEQATEAYNAAGEHAGSLRRQVGRAQDRIARQQDRVNAMRDALGTLAGAQYRSGGLASSLELLFSDNPADYLEKAAALDRIGARQSGQLRELRGALWELAEERTVVADELVALEKTRKAVARHKKDVERKLAAAQRMLNSLPPAERAAYERVSRSGGGMPDLADAVPPGPRAAAAVAAVRSALGRPYVWGASGPRSFDCSGLMQWSYAHAGIGLPRTSQAQRHAGRRVPLSQARPGDLVVYRADASHVAMYVGNGRVIHAPHPGAAVRYDPVAMMPISSVIRP
ncbi:NlpC/P60 family protein [Streptomyces sp. NPDC001588]